MKMGSDYAMGKEIEYLKEIIDAVICIPNAFRIKIENTDKYIFSISTNDEKTEEWYAVAAIYDSICEIDAQIKYAFNKVMRYELPETLENYNPFSNMNVQEREAFYHIENIVFRVSILWDLLAQLSNVIYKTKLDPGHIYYKKYFKEHSEGENTFELAKSVNSYLNEEDSLEHESTPWSGNHAFLTDYRNQMTHRVHPNVSSITKFGMTIRPPALYVLHRTIEDYYKVSGFLCGQINNYLEERKEWMPIGL